MAKKLSILFLGLLIGFCTNAQEKKDGQFAEYLDSKGWRLHAAASLAPGLLTENTTSLSLQGYAGFWKDHIDIRGDIFYFLSNYGDRPRFDMNHQLYFGAYWHFREMDKNFQPYVGFQPGAALSRSTEFGALNTETQELEYKITLNPVASVGGGVAYYAKYAFYMFAETRYILGKHKSNSYPVHLDEWKFSFGLGYFF